MTTLKATNLDAEDIFADFSFISSQIKDKGSISVKEKPISSFTPEISLKLEVNLIHYAKSDVIDGKLMRRRKVRLEADNIIFQNSQGKARNDSFCKELCSCTSLHSDYLMRIVYLSDFFV